MNKIVVFTVLAAAASGVLAQEQGRVLAATPVVQQVAVPQQVCSNEMVYSQRQPTGGGALLGAIVGGLAGSAIGGGSGRAAATALGAFGGSIVGNQVEAGPPGYRPMQRCGTQTSYVNQTIGYDVTYEYAGRRYTTRTQYDPGQWIPLTVQPAMPGAYGAAPAYDQPPAPGYGYYGNDVYQNGGYQGSYQGGYQGGYQGNTQGSYQNDGYYDNRYNNGGYAQPGVVVSGQSGYTAEPAIEYRDAYGRPYR